jgi:hypothetical protein
MKKLVAGECSIDNIFHLVDPTSFIEIDFEAEVVKALTCLLSDYWCGVFPGIFAFDGMRRSADLALIHKSISHWFIIEVEIAGHSLQGHVLPQVRCFRYGEPEQTCVASLCRAFPALDSQQAESLLRFVPRYVAVVGNLYVPDWHAALRLNEIQYLTVSVYRNHLGRSAHEVDGHLTATTRSLGFARYSAIDQCLRINKGCGLPAGQIQLIDQFGNPSLWTVREQSGVLWISKDGGPTLFDHHSYVQLVRTSDGRVTLVPSTTC